MTQCITVKGCYCHDLRFPGGPCAGSKFQACSGPCATGYAYQRICIQSGWPTSSASSCCSGSAAYNGSSLLCR